MTSATIKHFDPLGRDPDCDPLTNILRIFTYFLQSYFEHDEFRGTGMHWSDSEETTEMIITAEKPRVEEIEKVPHIVCVLGSSQWANATMDQLQDQSMSTGHRKHTDLIPMTVSYHCQSKEGLQSRRMAWFANLATAMFRREIIKFARLHDLKPSLRQSGESPASAYTGPLSSDELVSVVCGADIFFQYGWIIGPPAGTQPLNEIELQISVRGRTNTKTVVLLGSGKVDVPSRSEPGETKIQQKVRIC